jgi:hypothetical protein
MPQPGPTNVMSVAPWGAAHLLEVVRSARYDAARCEWGLLAFRDQVHAQHLAFGTYFIGNDARHAWLLQLDQYAVTVGGVSLKSWLADLLAGQVADVGP